MLDDFYRTFDTALRVVEGQCYGRHGTIDRNSDDNLYVRYLYWNDEQWNCNYNWLDNDFNVQNPAAVIASIFIAPRTWFLGSFVL